MIQQLTSATAYKSTDILLMIVLVLLSALFIFLLIKSIKRETRRYKINSDKSNSIDSEDFKKMITARIGSKQSKNDFSIVELMINDIDSLYKVFGETQIHECINELLDRIRKMLPLGSKFAFMERNKMWIYIKATLDRVKLENICRAILFETRKTITLVGALKLDLEVNLAGVIFRESGGTLENLISNLELTEITSRRKGVNSYEIFNLEISNAKTEEYNLYKEILEAIEKKDFIVFYQPIVNVNTLEVDGVEALLRWEHATKGILSPFVFLPILEHSGDIHWVGLWAFETIVTQAMYWKTNNPDLNIKIHINWSVSQLSSPALQEEVRKIIKKHKANPSDYCFEIADYNTAITIDTARNNLEIFRQIGINLAIDNYALEISTLATMNKSKINVIKLNKTFIDQITQNVIMRNIAQMLVMSVKEKNIKLIAEGVENIDMLSLLNDLGVTLAQGYYFSKPKTASETLADIKLTPWK